jgi:hypothetical protein
VKKITKLLYGPAKAGKTTFLAQKRAEGCIVLSGGDYAYAIAAAEGREDIAFARKDKDDQFISAYNAMAARHTIVNWIENELIRRRYGSRAKFVRAVILEQEDRLLSCASDVWYEVFDRAEGSHIEDALFDLSIDYQSYEMEREGITYGADGRQPPLHVDFTITAVEGKFLFRQGL